MALTQIKSEGLSANAITADKISSAVVLSGPKIANVQIANSSWSVLDDTAVDTAGGYIIVHGSGFEAGCQVLIGSLETSFTSASAVTVVSSSVLRVQVPAKSAGSYGLYVINSDGGTAIGVNALTYSGFPSWVTGSTLTDQQKDVAISIQLSATGATSYSLQAGSSLPSGTTLASNGLFSGTVTGITQDTTYSFIVEATDAENQNSPRTFSVTVTFGPQYELFMWGRSVEGQIPDKGSLQTYTSPIALGSTTKWTTITTGYYLAAGIKGGSTANGTLWLWGGNAYGQLGLNDIVSRSSPVQLGTGTNWALVQAASECFVSTKTDGTLWTWGRNHYGQLGLNDTVNRSSPVQVGSATNWSKINSGGYTCGAIKTDGTLWTWGSNNHGQLGLNDTVYRSSPVQVGTGTNWNKFNVAKAQFGTVTHISAIKTDGTLWAWGMNGSSQLVAQVSISGYRSSPVQVGSDTNWTCSAASGFNTLAIKSDGTLWAWGLNTDGQLGQNNRTNRTNGGPLQVGTDTSWSRVYAEDRNVVAIKTNGTLWVWGKNDNGQLGLSDAINRSSPVQLGSSTKWTVTSSEAPGSTTFVSLSTVVFALRQI